MRHFSCFIWKIAQVFLFLQETVCCVLIRRLSYECSQHMVLWRNTENEPVDDKTYNTTATSEDSNQPAQSCSLIRVLADCVCLYSLTAIQKWINKNPCQTGWMYRLICVFTGHTGLNVGFVNRRLIKFCGEIRKIICGHPLLSWVMQSIKNVSQFVVWSSGPSCSKLTMSLVNNSLKFTSSDTQICWNFLLKKCE